MNPVFEIIPEAIFYQQTNLFCQLNADGFSYFFENDIDKKIYGLSMFNFSGENNVELLKSIFKEQPLLHKKYKNVFISFSGIESALVPEEIYNSNENDVFINTLYGDLDNGYVISDNISNTNIYNLYRIPAEIKEVITEHFPTAVFSHYYSTVLKQNISGELLKIIFYTDTFIAALFVSGDLQIIQTYSYKSGTDVIYHLLNICQQFKLNNPPLQIGGMIEIDSDLHKEISHYFKNISFDELSSTYEFADKMKELIPHYFSHLFLLATCV